eukprot:7139494-Prymnesium_polylepis.1
MTLSSGAGFSAPGISPCPLLAGVTAHVRPAQGPPPDGHSPASHVGDAPGGTQPGTEHGFLVGGSVVW